MFFTSIKEINRLRKEINRLLSKEMNRWRKEIKRFSSKGIEINRLLSKGMSNIYLKVTIEKNWRSQNFDFLKWKTHYQFKWIQLNEWSNYRNMMSCLHLSS